MRFRAWRRGAYNDFVYTWFKALTEERLQYAEGYYIEQGARGRHVRDVRLRHAEAAART